jgi:DNA-directed RNA polymerase alpha subunit
MKTTTRFLKNLHKGRFVYSYQTINDIHSKLNLFENLEHDFVERQKSDLVETQKKVKALEEKVNVLEAGISNKNVPQEIKDVLVLSIDETNLSARVKTSCSQANIRKVEDLAAYTRTEFLKLRNCGKLSADEVGVFLKSKGLSWGMQF